MSNDGTGQDERQVKEVKFSGIWSKDSLDAAPTIYAKQLFLSHAGDEFYLVFGETFPPLLLPGDDVPPEDERTLTIKPLIKIAITKDRMESFMQAIKTNWDSFQKKGE